jgi:archaellum component FlaC
MFYNILVTVSDEYYDSSDGTSDIDEEIDQLETTLQALTAERDRLKQEASRQ